MRKAGTRFPILPSGIRWFAPGTPRYALHEEQSEFRGVDRYLPRCILKARFSEDDRRLAIGKVLEIEDGTLVPDMAAGAYTLEVSDVTTGGKTTVPFVIREGQTTKLDV